MKIGMVLDDTLDTPDGVQQYVLQVGSWLSDNGHDVHYLVGNTQRTDVPNVHSMSRNMGVKFNGNRMSMPLPVSRRRLKIFLAEQEFDVLHVQVPYSPFMAGRLICATTADTAVVGTFHILPYSDTVRLANRALALLNRSSAHRFDKMLAVSTPARDFARAIYGFDSDVVPNPVDASAFEAGRSESTSLNIVFLGRLVERKGALQLLRAIAYLRDNQLAESEFRVYIGGKGELQPQLERFIQEHQLSDKVTLQGFVPEEGKADFLAAADIAVYPSLGGESFGIVLLEAMAAARGVVLAGNNPGYASVMQPYPDQVFDPTNTENLAQRLAWYLDNPIGRERASLLQHQYVRRFDINMVGQELVQVYTKALQDRRGS